MPSRPGSSSRSSSCGARTHSAMVVQRWPSQPTYCRSSVQIAQLAGGSSVIGLLYSAGEADPGWHASILTRPAAPATFVSMCRPNASARRPPGGQDMPEGHTLHRLAREQGRLFTGRPVRASSPQGRFAEGASAIDGRVLRRVEAHRQAPAAVLRQRAGAARPPRPVRQVHPPAPASPPEPRVELRLRLVGEGAWTWTCAVASACELLDRDLGRRGCSPGSDPDPLRRGADPLLAYRRTARSQTRDRSRC